MAFPLVPFIAGAALGGVVAYLLKDDRIQAGLQQTASGIKDRFKGKPPETSEDVLDGEAVDEAVDEAPEAQDRPH